LFYLLFLSFLSNFLPKPFVLLVIPVILGFLEPSFVNDVRQSSGDLSGNPSKGPFGF